MTDPILFGSIVMAEFAARGFLRLDAVVPDEINSRFLEDISFSAEKNEGETPQDTLTNPRQYYRKAMSAGTIPFVNAGSPLVDAYPKGSALADMLNLPLVAGAIQSLVGSNPTFDHHFLHIAFPPEFYPGSESAQVSQNLHQDSTIDPRRAFDVQIMYYPHDVGPGMGGTRFVPGSHLRIVSEAAIGRYQNIRGQQHMSCKAGTLLFMHMGIWHGGGLNESDKVRYMFKIRICPTQRQVRLWDDTDLPADHFRQRPIFWKNPSDNDDEIHAILTRPEPWFEDDTARLEYLGRIRFWRYLLGQESFDADYWLSRIENEYT